MMEKDNRQVLNIYAESTPNPHSMKFVMDRYLLRGGEAEYKEVGAAAGSPLASALFMFPFVKGVFIAANFVTVTKDESADWYEIMPVVKDSIRNHILAGQPVFTGMPEIPEVPENSTEIEQKIIALLDEYVRPAVEQDGGAIGFKSYNQGVVTVQLKGACSGCPSSTLTLKAGIEALLKRMVPEVTEVVSEAV